jgi:hypothetical protein
VKRDDSEKAIKSRRISSPVFRQDLCARMPEYVTQDESRNDSIVERAEEGNELRDQIDR